MGGRVLGADVEGHALRLDLQVHPGVGGLGRDVAELLALGDSHWPLPSASAAGAPPESSVTSGISSTSTMPGQGFTRRASSG